MHHFDPTLLVLLVTFCLLGFVVIPLIAKLVGCRGCEIRQDCPWMSRGR